MIQTMMATISSPAARHAHNAQRQHALMLRRMMGLAIVGSGFAVIASEALRRLLGG